MNIKLSRMAAAAGLAVLSMASSATWAASISYDFKTFFDTSTAVTTDTKTLNYSVASLTIADMVGGGVQVTLKQNVNAFAAKTSAGTFIDNLFLGMSGASTSTKPSFANVSGTKYVGTTYSASGMTKDAGYKYNFDIDFEGLSLTAGGIKEGAQSVFTIKGTGVTAAAFAKAQYPVMIDLTNIGKPYNNSFLGLGAGNVRFIGTMSIPEPSTYALMGLGLVGIAAAARRRQQA